MSDHRRSNRRAILHRKAIDAGTSVPLDGNPRLVDVAHADAADIADSAAVNRALWLVRDEDVGEGPKGSLERIAESIERLIDRTPDIEPKVEPKETSAYASAIRVGTLERCYDLRGGGTRVAYVYHGLGGEDVVVSLPLRAESDSVVEQITNTVNAILGELEPKG